MDSVAGPEQTGAPAGPCTGLVLLLQAHTKGRLEAGRRHNRKKRGWTCGQRVGWKGDTAVKQHPNLIRIQHSSASRPAPVQVRIALPIPVAMHCIAPITTAALNTAGITGQELICLKS